MEWVRDPETLVLPGRIRGNRRLTPRGEWSDLSGLPAKASSSARRFRDLDDLNDQADEWCRTRAAERPCPEDPQRTVADVFAEERAHLIAAPRQSLPLRGARRGPGGQDTLHTIRCKRLFHPTATSGRTLVVSATLETVRILDAGAVLATHRAPSTAASKSKTPPTSKSSSATNASPASTAPPTASTTPPRRPRPCSSPPPNATTTSASSPADSSSCSTPTDPSPSNAPSPPRSNPTPRYLGGVRHFIDQQRTGSRQAPAARACPARRPAAAHPLGAPPRPRRLRPPRRIRLRRGQTPRRRQ